jgi:hypothetical protein
MISSLIFWGYRLKLRRNITTGNLGDRLVIDANPNSHLMQIMDHLNADSNIDCCVQLLPPAALTISQLINNRITLGRVAAKLNVFTTLH